MVSAVASAMPNTYEQYVQAAQAAEKNQVANTTMNADLQNLANVINDTTGTYSDADKVKAYTKEYNADFASRSNGNSQSRAERLQHEAFLAAIEGSSIASAVTSGQSKLTAYERSQYWGMAEGPSHFAASLTDLEKQLPQFSLLIESADAQQAQWHDQVTLSPEAKALLRATGPVPEWQGPHLSSEQVDALRQSEIANTELTPNLQKIANILNDATGTYSQSQKIAAYRDYFNAGQFLGTHGGANATEILQQDKFEQVVGGSEIWQAAQDGQAKQRAFGTAHGWNSDQEKAQFFGSLSDLQKQLPDFYWASKPLSELMKETDQLTQDPAKVLEESKKAIRSTAALFGETPLLNDSISTDALALEARTLFATSRPQASVPQRSGPVELSSAATSIQGQVRLTV